MGPLREIYNVVSNVSSRDQDHSPPTSSQSNTTSTANFAAQPHNDAEDGLTNERTKTSLTAPIWRRTPGPIKRWCQAVARWAKGPVPPRPWVIHPFFPRVQTFPLKILDRLLPRKMHKFWLLMFFYFCWLLVFSTVLDVSAKSEDVAGYGVTIDLTCVSSFWLAKNGCGVDGLYCRPFANNSVAFRCPANCLSTEQLNPYAVGATNVIYRPLVIGGPKNPDDSIGSAIYRADSFICSAAIHAGFITNEAGGCGVVAQVGERSDFPSVRQHGITSVAFPTYFPSTYKFLPSTKTSCKDLRWPLLGVTIIFTSLLSIFTTSPAIFFGSVFVGVYWHVALVSDPPDVTTGYYYLTSIAMGNFLPSAFIAVIIYQYVVKKSLGGLRAQFEKTILWMGGLWVGALNNYTFDKIPIQRLTPHDIRQQPGGVVALIIIVLVLLCVAIGQAWAFRIEGKFPPYLALYCFMGFCLLMLLAVPHMNLRIHHYILGLLLLPGTSLQTRPSLLYQGLLVGLFIDGVTRWGFSSILQTPGELLGDAIIGTALPHISTPIVNGSNITFTWNPIPSAYDGISMLVNDVERFRLYHDYESHNYTWTRLVEGDIEYFRFAYMNGQDTGDYTKAGTWHVNGSWTKMAPGPSK